MRTYVLRRLLLMVPMLFGISLVNFGILHLVEAPRSSSVGTSGEFDTSTSVEANEAEFIFRQTFKLDKPAFLNTRFALRHDEVLWLLATPLRPWEPPRDLRGNQNRLEDYGRAIVPMLLAIAEAAATDPPFADAKWTAGYAERWRDAREGWVAAGRPPGDVAWPPPAAPPAFDAALGDRVLHLALQRLASNAPRRPKVVFGTNLTPEIAEHNAAVRRERGTLRAIYADLRTSDREKLAKWKGWFAPRGAEWELSFGGKVRMLFLDTGFAAFWKSLATFDLGTSFLHRRPVWDLIVERLHVSLTLSLGALLLAYVIAIPLGILSAATHRSVPDRAVSVALFAVYSIPVMFLGVLLREYLGVDADLFPVSGIESAASARMTALERIVDRLHHLALPLVALTAASLAAYSRYMKAGLLDIIRADFVRTARAKGLSEFVVVVKHAARNGLIPIITLLGASLPVLIGGSVIVERIFGIDGMGKLVLESVRQRDYAVIMGLNVLTAILTMVGIFLADLFYAVADPRISYR